jgi:formate dehydrogenase major subunit
VAGLASAYGSGAMTNSLAEIDVTDLILLTGTNTTENHPVIASRMKRAVTQRGTKLIVIDPREIDMTRYADIYLRPKPGTDVAWINGLMHIIIKEELYDKEYVEKRTEDFDKVKDLVDKYVPEYVEEITGIPEDMLIEAARLYAKAGRASIYYAMGITQHTNGTDNVKSLANLAMLCGNVGIEGGGVNPLRGQNNVQGACDMGCLPNVYPGYQRVDDDSIALKFKNAWDKQVSKDVGFTIIDMFKGIDEGRVKAFYIMGENPMVSDPDLGHVEKTLKNVEFLVVQDIFMTETSKMAHIVLPTASFAEKEGTFTNTERRVQRVRKAIDSPGEAREDWQIIAELSRRMGYDMRFSSPSEILEEIAELTPSYAGISFKRLDDEGGLQWPCPTATHPGTKFLHELMFVRGRGLFHAIEHTPAAELPDSEYPLILSTGRVLEQFHTGTMTRRSKGLNEIYPEAIIEINPADAEKHNINDSDKITVISRRGSIQITAKITNRSPEGVVFIPFHFAEAAANRLTNPVFDPVAKIPEYKVCAVRVEK